MPAGASDGGEELLRVKVCRIGGKTDLNNPPKFTVWEADFCLQKEEC